jgi:hypothetical protein
MGIVMTAGINNRVADDISFAKHVTDALGRFVRNDWGDLGDEDRQMNDKALKTKMQILASYGEACYKIWIIKDAYDGPTTILYPDEY